MRGRQTKQRARHRTQDQQNEPEIGNVSAIMCKENGDKHMLKNIHDAPVDSNFHDDTGNAIKPHNVADYNLHVLCV